MFGNTFYHGLIRKYIIMFGNMFNDIEIYRYASDGNIAKQIRVPIAYAPKEKFYVRLREDPQLNRQVSQVLPRLAFELVDMSYNPERSLNKVIKNTSKSEFNSSLKSHFVPVPFDFNINLYGMFAYQEDAVQVVEQILPFFRPEWTHSMKLISDIDEYYDIPTVLSGLSVEDTYDTDFTQRRAITYTFNFTIKGYLIGPTSTRDIIKVSQVRIAADSDINSDYTKKVTVTPGLTKEGLPTSNAAASIAVSQINAIDNYGFAFESEDFFSPEFQDSNPTEEISLPEILDLNSNATINVTVEENENGDNVFFLNGKPKPEVFLYSNNSYVFNQSDYSNENNLLTFILGDGEVFSNVEISGTAGIDRQISFSTYEGFPPAITYLSLSGGEKFGNTISTISLEDTVGELSENTISNNISTATESADYTIDVTNNSSGNYIISGTDRTGSVSGDNASMTFNTGDIVDFNINASGHPFHIKTVSGTGTGNQAEGVTNNGADIGTVRWVVPASYSGTTKYYNCQYHASMQGIFTIN